MQEDAQRQQIRLVWRGACFLFLWCSVKMQATKTHEAGEHRPQVSQVAKTLECGSGGAPIRLQALWNSSKEDEPFSKEQEYSLSGTSDRRQASPESDLNYYYSFYGGLPH